MNEPNALELNSEGLVKPPFLIPLWTWLAILTASIAFFFHGASQGAPWQLDFGLKLTDQAKVSDQLAGLWGVPFLALSAVALYTLTLTWIERLYAEQRPQSWWDRLPAPEFWHFPSADPITRRLRLGVWMLVLVMVPFSLGHLAKKHFQLSIYEECTHQTIPGCQLMKKGPQPKAGKDKREQNWFREFTHEDHWQRFLLHIAPQHLLAEGYFDHRFHVGAPSHLTYFPGLQPWLYLGLMAWVYWLWLRILFSVVFGRPVLKSLGSASP